MLTKSVYLAYKKGSPFNTWHVIGILSYINETKQYSFKYTRGAIDDDTFRPFNGMEDLYKEYISDELYPLFKNRILYEKRPEYAQFIEWLGLHQDANPLDILSLSGGQRITDTLQTFGKINVDKDGCFEHSFFIHSLSFLNSSQLERISLLSVKEKLYFCLDPQNEYDSTAVLIRTNNPKEIVGYCPRYLSETIFKLLVENKDLISLEVEAINVNAPLQYRLRCLLKGRLPSNLKIRFNNSNEFQPLI
ncbi:HIRAN domain-containing protein [Bisgaard Taxon 10/6]|uniref:HIRAN domain-containing protein n=1 Tax=Exercitatus varius TaxID=67857 RepID=A0ABT6ERG8_9PAST|nr:HIRAN domain-containing protein [Exercitatus varius]MDG2938822.1 HIRAN domain-containing protein [Exercitatus varius]MDG2945980.1 HIRAN domain-containing protein [Exercitatus varius]MDG2951386.1 HIRAN domain-containing protein [Exercitatus varius]